MNKRTNKRIFFSVGEPSGDLHGSNLIRRLKQIDPKVECVGFGGPKMAAAGCDIHFDLTSLAVMFFAAVLKQLRTFFRLIGQADEYFQTHSVDAVILIDYPGFNWWIARKAKAAGIPVFYYGVPQMWAWAPWRVRKIRKFVDHVLCKLPFEVDWFSKRGCQARYVGHPYFDQLTAQVYDDDFLANLNAGKRPLVTLLPGSRNQEVETHLPILLDAAAEILTHTNDVQIAVACYNDRHLTLARQLMQDRELPVRQYVDLYVGLTPELMKSATVCLACSGSVSLELLYHRKPTVIVYRISRWFMVAQAFVLRTQFITLTNLIAAADIRKKTWAPYNPDRPGKQEPAVMPEYVTTGNPAVAMARHAVQWLNNPEKLQAHVDRLDVLAKKFALPGATDRAAEYIAEKILLAANKPSVYNDRSEDNAAA